ncbi:Nucleoporin NUP42 [Dissostichus eleginoides]|uniref:Nucleoporin NUP42 n=1 Tax=Dissostichus eleginoides TaxID=100907 RepID=A0AAD9EWU2_DISEL|nr:Nucleoporin NUP42 [Dissostichus eleginoides]
MTVCNFFLQGRWFGNRVWVNPSQQKAAYIQPSSFSSHGTEEWEEVEEEEMTGAKEEVVEGMTGAKEEVVEEMTGAKEEGVEEAMIGAEEEEVEEVAGGVITGGRGGEKQVPAGEDDDDKKLEIVQSDMDSWESSGQWGFSCYSYSKAPLSGFTDLSPEELRLEYYSTRESGDLQGYVNGITQLLNQWRSRVQELKVMNPATRAALLAEINNPAPQASSGGFGLATLTGFGSSTSSVETKGFGAPAAADSFSFAAPSGGFGSSAAPPSSTGFGSALAAPTQPPSGFGATSPSTFSFAAPTTDKPAAHFRIWLCFGVHFLLDIKHWSRIWERFWCSSTCGGGKRQCFWSGKWRVWGDRCSACSRSRACGWSFRQSVFTCEHYDCRGTESV